MNVAEPHSGYRFFGQGKPDGVIVFVAFVFALVFLNQHFSRFTVWFPLFVTASWLVMVRRDRDMARCIPGLLPAHLWFAFGCFLTSMLVSSLLSPLRGVAVLDLLRTLAGPLVMAVLVGTVLRQAEAQHRFFLALCWGGAFLAVTDVAHYIRDFATTGGFPPDNSHRWFSDGYLFYVPFLLLFRDTVHERRRALFNAGLFLLFLLIAGTGSRATWAVVLLEIAFLGAMTSSRQYVADLTAFILAIALGVLILPHETGMGALERGVSDNSRINGHWLPAIYMSTNSIGAFLIGHGYGREIWDTLHSTVRQLYAYNGPGLGGPHNVFLQALFSGGAIALVILGWIFVQLGQLLWRCRNHRDESLRRLALGSLVALAGFFLLAGQVGDPRPEPLAVLVLVAILLHRDESAAKPCLPCPPYKEIAHTMSEAARCAPVSVVIPCYHCADTIGRAVESVVAQTLRPAELVLVDDASGDGTRSELERLAVRYGKDWIRVLALPVNAGPGEARNAGWQIASQPLIAFLDADDAWHSRKIELQYQWMSANPKVLLTGHRTVTAFPGWTAESLPSTWAAWAVGRRELLMSNRFPTRSVMIRRDLPFRFERGKRHAEDYLLWLTIILSGHDGWFLDVPLAGSYKAEFGAGGLTGNLWKMEKGELDTYARVRKQKLVSPLTYSLTVLWSLIRYLRRVVFATWRQRPVWASVPRQ